MNENIELVEEPIEFEYSRLSENINISDRFCIKNMEITDNWPNCDGLSYCGGGVWYDRKTKKYSGNI